PFRVRSSCHRLPISESSPFALYIRLGGLTFRVTGTTGIRSLSSWNFLSYSSSSILRLSRQKSSSSFHFDSSWRARQYILKSRYRRNLQTSLHDSYISNNSPACFFHRR